MMISRLKQILDNNVFNYLITYRLIMTHLIAKQSILIPMEITWRGMISWISLNVRVHVYITSKRIS